MTKMAAMSIYSKTLKNLLLKRHWADCLETSLWPWADLGLFCGKVKFDPLDLRIYKAEIVHFSDAVIRKCSQLLPLWLLKVKVQRSLWLNIFIYLFFFETTRLIKITFHVKPMWILCGMEEWSNIQMVKIRIPKWPPWRFKLTASAQLKSIKQNTGGISKQHISEKQISDILSVKDFVFV